MEKFILCRTGEQIPLQDWMKKTQSDSKMNSASLEKVTFALIGNCEKYRSLKKIVAKRNLL